MGGQYTVGVEIILPREVNLEANSKSGAMRKAKDFFEDEYPGAAINVLGISDPEDAN